MSILLTGAAQTSSRRLVVPAMKAVVASTPLMDVVLIIIIQLLGLISKAVLVTHSSLAVVQTELLLLKDLIFRVGDLGVSELGFRTNLVPVLLQDM